MVRWMAALALLAAPVWAQGEEPEEAPEEALEEEEIAEDLGGSAARIARGERDAPAAFVRLREAGILEVKVGEEWKGATLNQLSKFLKEFADHQDREMQKDGKSAYEVVAGGVKASRLFVSIDVEPTIPWQHVQWLMVIAAEQKYWKLELSDGTRKMLAFLPTDRGIDLIEPPMVIKVSVHAVARGEKPGKWGDIDVLRPAEVRYKRGNDAEMGDLAGANDYIRKAHKAVKDAPPNCTIVGEIKAGNKVPFSNALDLMEMFEKAGLTKLDFYGVAIPPKAVREATRLPYPAQNYKTAD